MSVQEVAWRATRGGRSSIVRRRSEAQRLEADGAAVKPVSWRVYWRDGRKQVTKTFSRRRDAERYDAEVRRRLDLGEPVLRRRDVPTLEELAEQWFAQREQDVEAGALAPGTLSELGGLLDRYILPELGHLRLIDVRPARLDAWIAGMRAAGTSPYRIRRAAGLLTRMLGYAVRLEYLQGNPARELELPSHRYRKGRTASPGQVEQMRAYFLDRDQVGDATLISVLADGLRPAEALAAAWSGFDGRRVHVATHLRDGEAIEGTKRGARADFGPPRWVELAEPHAVDVVQWRLALGRPHGLIFPRSSDGLGRRKYDWDNWRKRSFRPAAGAAGLLEWDRKRKRWVGDFTPYDLRHTCASMMIAAGRPIAEVADHLGRGVDVCARTYAHVIDEMKGKPITPVDEAIRSARAEVLTVPSGARGTHEA
jgi:integrase